MNLIKIYLVATLLTQSISCIAAPKYPAPPLAGAITVSDQPYSLDKVNPHTSQVGDSQVFLVQKDGGNLAIGLLISGYLNSHLISKETQRIANSISKESGLDIIAKIKSKISSSTLNLTQDSPHKFIISSAILISIDSDDEVRSTLVINAEDTSESKGWAKSYFYHFRHTMNTELFKSEGAIDLLNKIASELDESIDITTAVILEDLSGKFPSGIPLKIKSKFLQPIGNVLIPFQALKIAERGDVVVMRVDGKPGLIRFPTVDGVHIFHINQFEIN